MTLKNLTGQQ